MPRYCFEISVGPSPYYWFAYFDTPDHLADFLFTHEEADVTVEGEYGEEENPYRIILCRIPKDRREAFLHAVDLLPALMAYVGKTDYDDFCRGVLADAVHFLSARRTAGGTLRL